MTQIFSLKPRWRVFVFVTALIGICSLPLYSQSNDFVIYDSRTTVTILYDTADYATVKLAGNLLAQDIENLTGHKPSVRHTLEDVKGNVIIIGSIDRSKFLQQQAIRKQLNIAGVEGKWETYTMRTLKKPLPGISHALVIGGSDKRGTAYGVFDLSQRLGVSPWYWWADVTPMRTNKLSIAPLNIVSDPPSVKYRGIFLNDEDWGLQPWAAKTFEPETGDIGPKTYARIFELLLRLKANLIWPAMHPSTKAFYHYPKNKEVADEYGIVVGSSHAEPMLRNNVDEWNHETMGDYNYITNRESVYNYWKQRAQESKNYENIYTIGMRGIHDSGMEGTADVNEKIAVLEKIFADQREIIKNNIAADVTEIPQAFIPYKEVLDVYDKGLKLPEDATIVWPDDNYGYIHRLNNEAEQKRAGGSGVYYHISYWGRPHDYLWLNGTHPMLIWEEMTKAHQTKSDRLWVVNVGDIKPMEYNTQLFLDMAYDFKSLASAGAVKKHLEKWTSDIFGKEHGALLAEASWEYYQLAFERRAEFMGWSQVEPTRATHFTEYNHFFYNDEAQKRLDRYAQLHQQVNAIKAKIAPQRQDAFYELVYYPVRCSQLMNRKFLQQEKAYYHAQQHRASANDLATSARQAYDSIVIETDHFNNRLANRKWKHMMSMQPRALPVFGSPMTPSWETNKTGWGVCVEGYTDEIPKPNQYGNRLPIFYTWNDNAYFLDVFLTGTESINWQATTSQPWIRLSKSTGTLTSAFGKKEERVWISIDKTLLPKEKRSRGSVTIKASGDEITIPVNVSSAGDVNGFVEENGYVSMFAEHYTRATNTPDFTWQVVDGLGYAGKSVMLASVKGSFSDKPSGTHAKLEYDFRTFSTGKAEVNVHCLPTHSLNANHNLRISISIDGKEPHIIDYRTFDRSETWKQNVLRNSAILSTTHDLVPGKHTLTITALDPGVVIDRITVDLGGLRKGYSAIPETKSQHR